MKQNLIDKINSLIEQSAGDELKLTTELSLLMKQIETRQANEKSPKPRKLIEVHEEYLDAYKNLGNKVDVITTGFKSIDTQFPLVKGEVVVVGARTGMGKTNFLVNLSLGISKEIPLLYCSFDLSEQALGKKFAGLVAKLPGDAFLKDNAEVLDMKKMLAVSEVFKNQHIYLQGGLLGDFDTFIEQCRTSIQQNGLEVIVIDDIQQLCNVRFTFGREAYIGYRMRLLKNLAKELNVCILIASQLSRAVEGRGGDKKPILPDLRESGAIEQVADKVLFLHRPEYYGILEDMYGNSNEGVMEVIIAKNKNGPVGSLNFKVDFTIGEVIDYYASTASFNFSEERLNEMPF